MISLKSFGTARSAEPGGFIGADGAAAVEGALLGIAFWRTTGCPSFIPSDDANL